MPCRTCAAASRTSFACPATHFTSRKPKRRGESRPRLRPTAAARASRRKCSRDSRPHRRRGAARPAGRLRRRDEEFDDRHQPSKLRVAEFAKIRGGSLGPATTAALRIPANSANSSGNAQLQSHQPAGLAVANFKLRFALDIDAGQQNPTRSWQNRRRSARRSRRPRPADGDVSVTQQVAFVGRSLVKVQILFELDDVRRTDLRAET